MEKNPNVMLMIETSRAYGRGLLRGIAKYSSLYGGWNIYRQPEFYMRKSGRKKTFVFHPEESDFDGIIMREQDNTEEILALKIPIIIVSFREETINIPRIDVDCDSLGRIAAEHFIDRGFKNFAYCGFAYMYWSVKRRRSFENTLNDAGYNVHVYEQSKAKSAIRWKDEKVIICQWLKALPKPIGLFACNDDRGEQVIDACKAAGIRIPDEIAVLGVDNDEFVCGLTAPPLSSIALNTEQAGFQAAEMLNKLMTNRNPGDNTTIIVSGSHVVTRQSSDILAIEDQEVSRAVHFIRENITGPIQVNDVVRITTLSRCGLYQRFHKVLGHSVHDEIKRVRSEKIAQLLLDSDFSIGQIALKMGFQDSNHIARYFKKIKGVTPLAYRKKQGQKPI